MFRQKRWEKACVWMCLEIFRHLHHKQNHPQLSMFRSKQSKLSRYGDILTLEYLFGVRLANLSTPNIKPEDSMRSLKLISRDACLTEQNALPLTHGHGAGTVCALWLQHLTPEHKGGREGVCARVCASVYLMTRQVWQILTQTHKWSHKRSKSKYCPQWIQGPVLINVSCLQ